MAFLFRLETEDGEPAEPATLNSAVPNWDGSCLAVRSGGQQLAKPLDVSKVLWLEHDLTGVEVDLHHAGELNGSMPRGADETVQAAGTSLISPGK